MNYSDRDNLDKIQKHNVWKNQIAKDDRQNDPIFMKYRSKQN